MLQAFRSKFYGKENSLLTWRIAWIFTFYPACLLSTHLLHARTSTKLPPPTRGSRNLIPNTQLIPHSKPWRHGTARKSGETRFISLAPQCRHNFRHWPRPRPRPATEYAWADPAGGHDITSVNNTQNPVTKYEPGVDGAHFSRPENSGLWGEGEKIDRPFDVITTGRWKFSACCLGKTKVTSCVIDGGKD